MYNYTRKSVDANANLYEQDECKLGQTSPFTRYPPQRPRLSSNDKRFDYRTELEETREARPRTPSATEFGGRNKLEASLIGDLDYSNMHIQSQGKGKRITKNYVGGLGNTSYGDVGDRRRHHEKENMNRMNEQRGKKGGREEEAIKGSFEKLNEQEILNKIGRINKLNSEINGRLEKILARVSHNE